MPPTLTMTPTRTMTNAMRQATNRRTTGHYATLGTNGDRDWGISVIPGPHGGDSRSQLKLSPTAGAVAGLKSQ